MCVATALVLNGLMKFWFASECGRQLAEDRKGASLELLLSTPLTVKEVLHGQFLALRRQFLGPVLLVLTVFFAFMMTMLPHASVGEERTLCLGFWIGAMVMLLADLAALYWIGMWQALSAKNPNRRTSTSLVRVVVLPWIGILLVLLVGALTSWSSGGDFVSATVFLGTWFVLGLVADIGFGAWARYCLLSKFRLVAEQRYSKKVRTRKIRPSTSPPEPPGPEQVLLAGK